MKKVLIPVIVGCLIISCGLVGYGLMNRYYVDTSTHMMIDRLTGRVSPMFSQEPKPSEEAEGVYRQLQERVDNIKLLLKSEKTLDKFTEYYDACIINVKTGPLYYDASGWTA
jgi:hypothetical protein